MNAKEKLADYQRQFGVYAEANPEVMGLSVLQLPQQWKIPDR